jgi:hypothetical protein
VPPAKFSVKELSAKTSESLTTEGHGESRKRQDQALTGLMKPNLVRALIQRGALR